MLVSRLRYGTFIFSRNYSVNRKNPITRTWDLIAQEIPSFFSQSKKETFYPEHADIVIIGGGYIGSSVAHWLKTRAGDGLSIVVLEKDPTYKAARQNLSLGTITQHFSLPENIHLSLFGAEFLRNVKKNLNTGVDIEFYPHGHLVLASERYADRLEYNVTIQREYGVKNKLLSVKEINNRFPWINTEDIHLGSLGTESEGTYSSWKFLKALVQNSVELGTTYVNAEVVGFELEAQKDMLMEGIAQGTYKKINRVIYKTPDGEEHGIKFAVCVLAAGHQSGSIAEWANLGTGDGLLKVPLPIKTREHKIYSVDESAQKTGLATPIITDTSGLWLRKNGLTSNLLCGHAPLMSIGHDDAGDDYFNKIIKPSLDNRVPNFKDAKVNQVLIEHHDYNSFDDTGIMGPHPYHNNLIIAAGFGTYGCSHAPGIGRSVAELIVDSNFSSIDLTRFTFDRLLTGQPLVEFNIY